MEKKEKKRKIKDLTPRQATQRKVEEEKKGEKEDV